METQKFGREYHRAYYYKRRQKVFDYLGGVCAKCGSSNNLEVDHIDPATKSYEIKSRLSVKNNIEELNKCQLLCRDCHLDKTAKENSGFTHGTMYGWMKIKCECSPCNEEKRRWNTERNAKRRTTPE